MISVSVEVREGAFARRVRISASSIELALKLAGDGKSGCRVRLLFPIDPEAFFVPENFDRRRDGEPRKKRIGAREMPDLYEVIRQRREEMAREVNRNRMARELRRSRGRRAGVIAGRLFKLSGSSRNAE